jgi:hypothetical protein
VRPGWLKIGHLRGRASHPKLNGAPERALSTVAGAAELGREAASQMSLLLPIVHETGRANKRCWADDERKGISDA